ncbi:TniQ family protein [Rhodoferax sp. BLA1]|uniref:TniQ family protein n=1 Tax=Rhodoferax sp. BLA1 TaxID=2576062 RepID=UPI0021030237|nr:TniQ family protein [Rhodoferax sp. BLA1]
MPVGCSAQQGESGMGFLLRCATANGVSLHGLRDLCGISSVRTIWSSDAASLAGVLAIPAHELQDILVDKRKHMDALAYRVGGQIILRTELLRLSKPQVCVACVHRDGYCKALWDSRLYTVCHIHRTPMVEQCKVCGSPLRWHRPAVDVCQCGAYLQSDHDQVMHPDASEVWVAGRIANYFASGCRFEGMSGALPTWMVELSLDGFLALIQAFGVQLQPHQKVVNASVAKMPVEFWRGVCCRAVQRLSDYTVSKDTKQLSPWIWEGGLESLALSFVRHADQQVAIKLLRDVFGIEVLARFGSQRTVLCQMPLFED